MASLDSYSITLLEYASKKTEINPAAFYMLFPDKDHIFIDNLAQILNSQGYLEKKVTESLYVGDNSGIYKITPQGISYLEDKIKQNKKEKKEKKQLFFNSFRAWITLGIAVLSFIVSSYNTIQTNNVKYEELVSFANVYEEDYYFDGNTLSKEISFIISNNSQVNISLIGITLTRGGEYVNVHYDNNSYSLPMNLPSNNSIKQSIYIIKELEPSQIDSIVNEFGIDCYINTFELDAFIEEGVNLYKGTTIESRPSIKIVLTTSNENEFMYESRAGANG